MESIGYVYIIVNELNEFMYIGLHKSKNGKDKYKGSGTLLQIAQRFYNKKNFTKKILEWCDSDKKLNEQEKYWIAFYDTFEGQGYNLTSGGGHSHDWDEELKKEASTRSKKQWKNEKLLNQLKESMTERWKDSQLRIDMSNTQMISWQNEEKRNRAILNNKSENNPMFGKTHLKITCKHCGKTISKNLYHVWHGKNCLEHPTHSIRNKKRKEIITEKQRKSNQSTWKEKSYNASIIIPL